MLGEPVWLPQCLRSLRNAMTLEVHGFVLDPFDLILRLIPRLSFLSDGPQVCKVRWTVPRPAFVNFRFGKSVSLPTIRLSYDL